MKSRLCISLPVAGLLILILLSSCITTPAVVTPSVTAAATATQTIPPTQIIPTASPQPGKAVLIIPAETDPALAKPIQAAVELLARQSGVVLEVKDSFKPAPVDNWKVIVYLNPPADLAKTAGSMPAIQFLAISLVDMEKAPNLSVVRIHPEEEAFLAGFITMLAAPEWRAGALLVSDTPLGATLDEVFKNGGYYFCGACRSALSPMLSFPITASLPANSNLPAWQTLLEELRKNIIYTLYVSPQAATPELLQYLVAQKFYLVGGVPPAQEIRSRWIATVSSDPLTPLQRVWPDVLTGKGGQVIDAPVVVNDVQAALLGAGKQQMVEELRKNLASGQVYPFVVR